MPAQRLVLGNSMFWIFLSGAGEAKRLVQLFIFSGRK